MIDVKDKNRFTYYLQTIFVEVYEVFKCLSQVSYNEKVLGRQQNQYNLRNISYFDIFVRKKTNCEFENHSCSSPIGKLLDSLSSDMKEITSMNSKGLLTLLNSEFRL